ncbi:hypothetical protein AJ78_05642 [Emergomyces pasteurianus Ep9510]|uniref:Alpha-N-acetylglucosaminidase n=1 Tax=Emergomyces pasteurianus Ep9510 TaxID=1447872 RepID=A0A1J9Q1A1_9EURO|nr:hypothetical protein AJ78_05642 [Emergomyces pasteurianus Ep9510]
MRLFGPLILLFGAIFIEASDSHATDGIIRFLERRLPSHVDSFKFSLVGPLRPSGEWVNDKYTVSTDCGGKIHVQANSMSGLFQGLHRYLSDVVHVDIFWYIGNRLSLAPRKLPAVRKPLKGESSVPWRYQLNTVTFSYTMPWFTWEDWEFELDWLAIRGVNLPLAWTGYEKILISVFREAGFTDDDIQSFISGPAFLAWNRFGNIQGSWGGGNTSFEWYDAQSALQKKILCRMTELGMTPVLPAFPGYVPRAVSRVFPDAQVVNASQWAEMDPKYTNTTFLQPFDPLSVRLQKSFISKSMEVYGNVTHFYTLDQFNEMTPSSGDPEFLRNVSETTMAAIKSVNPDATWVMQGWLFYIFADYWSPERIEAYLSAGKEFRDMLILDLFAESFPVWKNTKGFFGKAFIWCQVQEFGGNNGFYGHLANITEGPAEAMAKYPNMVGMGNAGEGQGGNEVVYSMLLDQAWSKTALDPQEYIHNWVTRRYSRPGRKVPKALYKAWELLRISAYNNTNLVDAPLLPHALFAASPTINAKLPMLFIEGLLYDPALMVNAWKQMLKGALFGDSSYHHDMVDVTRQVLSDAFTLTLQDLKAKYKGGAPASEFMPIGRKLLVILKALDAVLSTSKSFWLSNWISAARASAGDDPEAADFFEYNARNQITTWGPTKALDDYAQKQWAGLVSGYYYPRWRIFLDYLKDTPVDKYDDAVLKEKLIPFETDWISQKSGASTFSEEPTKELESVLGEVQKDLDFIFSSK